MPHICTSFASAALVVYLTFCFLKKLRKKLIVNILRLFVSVLLLAWVLAQLPSYNIADALPAQLWQVLALVAALVLLPLNLGIEVIKWRMLLQPQAPSWAQAWQGVLCGATLGFISPNRIGEYLGRALAVPHTDGRTATWATLWARQGQLVATVGAALPACMLLPLLGMSSLASAVLAGVCALSTGALALLWLRPQQTLWHVQHLRWLSRLLPKQLEATPRTLVGVLSLSFGRHFIILLQYACLLYAFGAVHGLPVVMGYCALVFVIKACIPSLAFAEIGIRESVALWVMCAGGLTAGAVFHATAVLFLVNLALPALVGGWATYHLGFWQRLTLRQSRA